MTTEATTKARLPQLCDLVFVFPGANMSRSATPDLGIVTRAHGRNATVTIFTNNPTNPVTCTSAPISHASQADRSQRRTRISGCFLFTDECDPNGHPLPETATEPEREDVPQPQVKPTVTSPAPQTAPPAGTADLKPDPPVGPAAGEPTGSDQQPPAPAPGSQVVDVNTTVETPKQEPAAATEVPTEPTPVTTEPLETGRSPETPLPVETQVEAAVAPAAPAPAAADLPAQGAQEATELVDPELAAPSGTVSDRPADEPNISQAAPEPTPEQPKPTTESAAVPAAESAPQAELPPAVS